MGDATAPNSSSRFEANSGAAAGTRRPLWQLPADARDAVLGTTFHGNSLRLLLDAMFKGRSSLSTTALHAAAVRQCAERNRLSQRLQAELDRCHRATLRQFAGADSVVALQALWAQHLGHGDLAGALWATLTHPTCSAEVDAQVLGDVRHAHYAAMAAVRAVADENAVLTRELARVQQRSTRAQATHAALRQQWQSDWQQQRAALDERDAKLATLQALQAPAPAAGGGAPDPALQPARERAALLEDRVRRLQQALQLARHEGGRASTEACDQAKAAGPAVRGENERPATPVLNARSVLCVGGRPGQVPIYRDLVERHGGHFAHHDGGIADRPQQLDAVLAAADLVICQAGCISHNAYWLVKDHCKRTGKRCVYLQNASATSFERGLALLPADTES